MSVPETVSASHSTGGALPTRVADIARHAPARTAVHDARSSLTFGELAAEAELWARAITARTGPGDRVAVCGSRRAGLVAAVLGCLRAGRVYVPLDPGHPAERTGLALDDAQAALVLVDDAAPAALHALPATLRLDQPPPAEGELPPPPHASDAAYVIYTSGSTGQPKGVVSSHGGLAALTEGFTRCGPALGAGDTVLAVASMAFDMSITDVFVPLATGATVVLPPEERLHDPDLLLELIERHGVTAVLATPSLWRMLVLGGLGTGGRRKVRAFGGGEKLTERLAGDLLARTASLHNGYGPTESTVYTTFAPIAAPDQLPLGDPLPGTLLHVLDGAGRLLPPGARGELYIGGPQVSTGYHGRPALTAERFVPDPFTDVPGARMYRTGDLVRREADGALHFLGRADDQVKIRGHRVEPGEVAAALERHPGIRQAAVVAREGTLVGFATPAEGQLPSPAALLEHTRRLLPEAMVPSRVTLLPALPTTANGKVDTAALRAWAASPAEDAGETGTAGRAEAAGEAEAAPRAVADPDPGSDPDPVADAGPAAGPVPAAPGTETELTVAAMWAEVLGLATVDARTSFFDLGGHSLLAMEIVARLRAEYQRELPVWELFADPTVRGWAAVVDRADAVGAEDASGTEVRAALSAEQRALCRAERLVPGVTSPGLTAAAELTGAVDTGRVTEALAAVVRRQDCLRTRFSPVSEHGSQVVSPHVRFDMLEADLRGAAQDGTQPGAPLDELTAPFDLGRGPLLRALLSQVADDRFRLELCAHDSVTDPAGLGVLLTDFARAYAGGDDGPPAVRFTALAEARGQEASGTGLAEAVNAFRAAARGAVAVPAGGEATALLPVRVSAGALQAASDTALARNLTVEDVLTAALLAPLPPEWGTRLVVGRTVPGRSGASRELVGPLASLLLTPVDRAHADDPADLAVRVAAARKTATEHGIPAPTLLEALERTGESALHRVLPWVAVTLRRPPPRPRRLGAGAWLTPLPEPDPGPAAEPRVSDADGAGGAAPSPGQVTALPLALDLWPDGEALVGHLQYRPDLLDARAVRGLADAFTARLETPLVAAGRG